MTSRLLLFLLLPALGLLSACKRQADEVAAETRTVVLLCAQEKVTYEAAQKQNLMRLVATRPEFNLKTHDAAGQATMQVEQFRQCLLDKPVAIFVTPVDAKALSDVVGEAVQAGVLVVGLTEAAQSMPCSSVIACDQRELGRLAGEVAARALIRKAEEEGQSEARGRVVEIRGDEQSPASQARHDGFLKGLEKAPGAVLVHDAPGDWTKQGGKDRTSEALRLQARFDVIYAHSDVMALGAAAALGNQRENVMIIGTDGLLGYEGGLSMVNQGDLDATLYQPILIDLGWKLLLRKLSEPTFLPPPSYRLAPFVITPKNAADVSRTGLPALPEL